MKKQIQLLRGTMILIALLTINSTAFADFVIKGGTTINVKSGTTLVSNIDVVVEGTGTIDNSGTITLKGDFTNGGTANLGTGEFILAGTAAQTVGGTAFSEFATLTVNNTGAGITLSNSIRVDAALTLTDGLVNIDNFNLTIGTGISSVGGTPTDQNMIVTGGTGELRKEFFGALGVFIFPVGDNDGTAEYSPLELDVTAGDFIAADYLGVKVSNVKHPNNNSYSHYLNRYWSITKSVFSGLNYDAEATYLEADIAGTETNILEGFFATPDWYIGDPVDDAGNTISIPGLIETGDITGVEFEYLAGLRIFLQGAYDDVAHDMRTTINYLLPTSAATAYSYLGYSGPETATTIPANAVDWVLVELRDAGSANAAGSGTVVQTVAGFVMEDGSIVSAEGLRALPFTNTLINDPYFVVIHRNHLSVMTASTPSKLNSTYDFNFTTAIGQGYGTDALILLETGVYGLIAGETNVSGIITYADKQSVDDNINLNAYHIGDSNLSGLITYEDKQFVDDNIYNYTRIPK